MSLKDKLLSLANKLHSIEVMGTEIFYTKVKQSHNPIIMAIKDPAEQNATIFALCVCEADGTPSFSLDNLDEVKQLPASLITTVVAQALNLDEKKAQGN